MKKLINLSFKKIAVCFLIVITILASFYLYYFTGVFTNGSLNTNDNCCYVHFIDVGKADAILIKLNDKAVLIDSGDISYDKKVNSYLKRLNINKIDLLVESHPDNDHIGSMKDIIEEFKINEFLAPNIPEQAINSSLYSNMINSLKAKNIPIKYAQAPDSINIDELKFDILGPVKIYEDNNSNSLVLKLNFKNKKILFTGDCTAQAEEDMLKNKVDLKSDVLKVAHHGSKTSTSENFLKAVSPEYAIISVGADKNNLPKQEILKRLQDKNIKIFRTDINGNIVLKTNGDDIIIKTEK